MASTSSVSQSTVTSSDRFIGRVKWFNNKAGYGFITVSEGERSGTDIFVHHSGIQVSNEQYKYLVQGEYIEFTLSNVSSGDHEFQAVDVSGIKGGKLMCETRNELRTVRSTYKEQPKEQSVTKEEVKVEEPFNEVKKSNRKPRQPSAPVEGGRGSGSGSGSGSGAGRGRGRPAGSGRGRGSGRT